MVNNKSFFIGFFYFSYTLFIIHFLKLLGIMKFMASFSIISIYFSIYIIGIYALSIILLKRNKIKKIPSISTALISSISLSHTSQVLKLDSIFETVITSIDFFHVYIGYFLVLIFFFFIGAYLLKFTTTNKQILFFPIAIIFIHTIYLFFSYDSYNKQKQIYENVYSTYTESNNKLNSCGKTLYCSNMPMKDLLLISQKETKKNELHKSIIEYMNIFSDKVSTSNKNIISLSYLDIPNSFINKKYKPIGVFNKTNNNFILDYSSANLLIEKATFVYLNITGTAGFCWMLFQHLLIFFHFIYKTKTKKHEY